MILSTSPAVSGVTASGVPCPGVVRRPLAAAVGGVLEGARARVPAWPDRVHCRRLHSE